jgi:adenosylmethionine-8-amino-7-oxononanoate aminotransferase
VIAEPIIGTGGVMVPPPEYWPRLRTITKKYGVTLIADEVITGFG